MAWARKFLSQLDGDKIFARRYSSKAKVAVLIRRHTAPEGWVSDIQELDYYVRGRLSAVLVDDAAANPGLTANLRLKDLIGGGDWRPGGCSLGKN